MSLLSVSGLGVDRGGRAILSDVTFDLPAGSFVALVGANGAGKSTLLAALAGLLRPDRGTITLDGLAIERIGLRDLARRRAYLPQAPRVEWPISVERLVALGLLPELPAFGGMAAIEPRLTGALESFDLTRHRHQPATTLSGGELGRAMLARALIGQPQVLIADEPIAGLDPSHALDTVRRLERLATGEGRLVVAALHDLTLAARHSTHLMALKEGRIAAFGPTSQVLTADLVADVFAVRTRILGEGGRVLIDFLGPDH